MVTPETTTGLRPKENFTMKYNIQSNIDTEIVHDFVNEGDVFCDIGANEGLYTQLINRKHKGKVEIHSFEPHPEQYSQLLSSNCKNINTKCYNVAVSNFVGKTKLWYEPNDPVNKFGASTIMSELAVSRRLGDSMEYLEVDTVTIDSLELAPNFIKIDAEGAETDILTGASDTIQKNKPIITIEYGTGGPENFHPKSVNILREYGYNFLWNIEQGCQFRDDVEYCNILAIYEN